MTRYLLYQQLNVGNEKLASDVYKKAVGRGPDTKLLYATSKVATSTERPRVARMKKWLAFCSYSCSIVCLLACLFVFILLPS
jgi:hypothetical protein